MLAPADIQAIGNEIAIRWEDGSEDYFPMEKLRAASPSAENVGERDLTGNVYGGTDQTEFPGVAVRGWNFIGGYALQFDFSDGHATGIYSYQFLKDLAKSWSQKA